MYKNISLAKNTLPLIKDMINNFEKFKINVLEVSKATIIDCGLTSQGSIIAGLSFTKIALGGLADVQLTLPLNGNNDRLMTVQVSTSFPTLATLGCQAASWNVNIKDFSAMVCGPGRALAQKPSKIYKLLNYKDESDIAIFCMEANQIPSEEVITYFAEKCAVKKENLILLVIKTNCLVEYIQMASRAIEIGVFKLVELLNFPFDQILHAVGLGIVSPITNDIDNSNDRVNNALIYGTKLFLVVQSTPRDNLDKLIKEIPSKSSSWYGQKFLNLFSRVNRDFSKFDLKLLAPSEIVVNDIRTGKIYQEGKIDLQFIKS